MIRVRGDSPHGIFCPCARVGIRPVSRRQSCWDAVAVAAAAAAVSAQVESVRACVRVYCIPLLQYASILHLLSQFLYTPCSGAVFVRIF